MNSLRCENLTKSFDGVHAVADARLEFPPSGIVALIGPNGAGKTTLINILTGFLRPESGTFYLGEREISRLPPHRIARLGIARTFQELRLISQISVIDNVLLARPRQRGEALFRALFRAGVAAEERHNREEAGRCLDFVGLANTADDLAGELSYGQQKLLTLACCLATDARILLLDEPVAGVYPSTVAQILALLQQLRDLGKLVVFIEHDLASVRQVADLVIVMDEGRIIAQGNPSEVLDRPEIIEAYVT